eukprot:1904416-Amphidinium_carterae.1
MDPILQKADDDKKSYGIWFDRNGLKGKVHDKVHRHWFVWFVPLAALGGLIAVQADGRMAQRLNWQKQHRQHNMHRTHKLGGQP